MPLGGGWEEFPFAHLFRTANPVKKRLKQKEEFQCCNWLPFRDRGRPYSFAPLPFSRFARLFLKVLSTLIDRTYCTPPLHQMQEFLRRFSPCFQAVNKGISPEQACFSFILIPVHQRASPSRKNAYFSLYYAYWKIA